MSTRDPNLLLGHNLGVIGNDLNSWKARQMTIASHNNNKKESSTSMMQSYYSQTSDAMSGYSKIAGFGNDKKSLNKQERRNTG